jgi:hypothetical protein
MEIIDKDAEIGRLKFEIVQVGEDSACLKRELTKLHFARDE